jgi:hypothetical protein
VLVAFRAPNTPATATLAVPCACAKFKGKKVLFLGVSRGAAPDFALRNYGGGAQRLQNPVVNNINSIGTVALWIYSYKKHIFMASSIRPIWAVFIGRKAASSER